jgi:hypothetical protein
MNYYVKYYESLVNLVAKFYNAINNLTEYFWGLMKKHWKITYSFLLLLLILPPIIRIVIN